MKPSPYSKTKGYQPDKRLKDLYQQADQLDSETLDILCPSYSDLAAQGEHYTNFSLIGKGALKEVYRCFDERTQRFIALAKPRIEHDPDCYDSFIHEAWLISSLNHPNIIKVYDTGVDKDTRPYFTMDLKGNATLADAVKQETARPQLLDIFLKVCDAVAYAHAEGVIHRDLKPENIQCDSYGEVLVCDWGLGKFLHEETKEPSNTKNKLLDARNLTSLGQIKGSLGYMAPEQIEAIESCDERSDIFALGCLLHFILTTETPFRGSEQEVLDKTTQPLRRALRFAYPQLRIPKGLDAITLKAIAHRPEDRYNSVTELQADIHKFLSNHCTIAENASLIRHATLFIKRNQTPVAITACALVALTTSILLFSINLNKKELEASQARQKSQQLSTEVDTLSSAYEDLLTQTEEPRRAHAKKLTITSINKKRKFVYDSPKIPFRNIQNLIEQALELDPESPEAQAQYFSNQCIILNFKNAQKYPTPKDINMTKYIALVEAFPDYDFSERHRPSIEELTHFFREAKKISTDFAPLMLAILSYDYDTRKDKSHYAPVVGAILEYLNPAPNDFYTEYDKELDQLTFNATQTIRSSLSEKRSIPPVLDYLKVDTLVVNISDSFHIGSLNQSSIRRLDLSNATAPILTQQILIDNLEEVIINPEIANIRWGRRVLTSASPIGYKVTVAK